MTKRIAGLLSLPTLLLCAGLSGQVAWETPFLVPPGGGAGLGVYLLDYSGGGLGAGVTYRSMGAPAGLGFRGGLGEQGAGGDLALFGGVDLAGSLVPGTEEVPLDVIWVAGVGAGIGNEILVSAPAGISVGGTFVGEGVTLLPYATPRVVLDLLTGAGDTFNLDFAIDLGLNLAFHADWELRFAASVGDREAVAVGIGIPG